MCAAYSKDNFRKNINEAKKLIYWAQIILLLQKTTLKINYMYYGA